MPIPTIEIYYIYKGSRQLLLTNALTHVVAPALVVIPPQIPCIKPREGLFRGIMLMWAPPASTLASSRCSISGPCR